MRDGIPADFALAPPQAATSLVGHADAEAALAEAWRAGRLHHAWLIDGPQGIGKATLAYRFARFLLSRRPDDPEPQAATDLAVPADHPVARQVTTRAHPDLFVLERPRDEEGRATAAVISVDAVRRVARFLSTTSPTGGWRVVIVDTADDLNRSSANALLKMLEEPPQRSVFLLLSATPGRLLATIRSRCRRLSLKPLPREAIVEVLDRAGIGADGPAREVAAGYSAGSLGKAIELADGEAVEAIRAVRVILEAMPRHDPLAAQALAERLGRRGAEERYAMTASLIVDWIAARCGRQARSGADVRILAPWAEVWEKVTRALAETERLNLDRTLTLLSVFRIVSAAASHDVARV